jgi:hypothetical protein
MSDHDIRITVEGGTHRDFVRSPDLKSCSVLWENPNGKLTCRFPYGQSAEFDADGEVLTDRFIYSFLNGPGCTVTTRLGRGAPMVPRLLLNVALEREHLPATLQWDGRELHNLSKKSSVILVELPRSKKNVLEQGDWNVTLKTKKGSWKFLIGVDPDGTPAASSGFIRRDEYSRRGN